MRQGSFVTRVAALALAVCVAGGGLGANTTQAVAATPRATQAKPQPSKATGLRQFTGIVTSLDATSITVEKRGKQPRTMVFDRRDDTKTTGDLTKDARVTVYYRDESGKAVARKVVVKAAGSTAAAGSPRRR